MESYPTKYEIDDFDNTHIANIELVDSECVQVKLFDATFTLESWKEFSREVENVITKMLKKVGE